MNRRDWNYTRSINDFRDSMKVLEESHPDWRELKKCLLRPAVEEVNFWASSVHDSPTETATNGRGDAPKAKTRDDAP